MNKIKDTLKQLVILYIEDEDNIRENIKKTLLLLCKNVITAQNAEDALEIYQNNRIDIIISDINLPKMSGLDFTKKIRNTNRLIPIILLTAYTDTKYLLEASKLKLVDYLTKPIDFDSLLEVLKKATLEVLQNGQFILEFTNNTSYNLSTKLLTDNKTKQEIKLTSSEIKLLEYLIQNKQRVASSEELLNNIWEDPFEASIGALKNLLNKLRNKIGKESITNISGVGYRVILK